MSTFRGLYKQIKTGRLFFAEGLAYNATNPMQQMVVYCQKYDAMVSKGDNRVVPTGSLWYSSPDHFSQEFVKVPEPSKTVRLMNSIITALEKDIASGYNKGD